MAVCAVIAVVCAVLAVVPSEARADEVTVVTMLRVYNPNNSAHHYTPDSSEANYLTSIGWQYEGVDFYAYQETNSGLQRGAADCIHRMYNPNSGEHFLTSDNLERSYLARQGWDWEGCMARTVGTIMDGRVGTLTDGTTVTRSPLYRLYNPNNNGSAGAHHYTTSKVEYDDLCALGWVGEDVAFYVFA